MRNLDQRVEQLEQRLGLSTASEEHIAKIIVVPPEIPSGKWDEYVKAHIGERNIRALFVVPAFDHSMR